MFGKVGWVWESGPNECMTARPQIKVFAFPPVDPLEATARDGRPDSRLASAIVPSSRAVKLMWAALTPALCVRHCTRYL
jgi:hypothetical protein